jgi:hypothetical protein
MCNGRTERWMVSPSTDPMSQRELKKVKREQFQFSLGSLSFFFLASRSRTFQASKMSILNYSRANLPSSSGIQPKRPRFDFDTDTAVHREVVFEGYDITDTNYFFKRFTEEPPKLYMVSTIR